MGLATGGCGWMRAGLLVVQWQDVGNEMELIFFLVSNGKLDGWVADPRENNNVRNLPTTHLL